MSRQLRLFPLVCLMLLVGCASSGNTEVLESELRKAADVRLELEERVSRLETDLRVARNDSDLLRKEFAKNKTVPTTLEHSTARFRVQELKIHPMMTGGWNQDSSGGDDGLTVLLTPVDEHGDLIKIPGDVEIELLDLATESENKRIGLWKFTSAEVSDAWHKGIISSGFLLRVPWQTQPENEKLTVSARLKIADGRRFDASLPVVVTLNEAVAERIDTDPGPSRYHVRAETISVPKRLPRAVKESMPEDGPLTRRKLPPPPVEPGGKLSDDEIPDDDPADTEGLPEGVGEDDFMEKMDDDLVNESTEPTSGETDDALNPLVGELDPTVESTNLRLGDVPVRR